MPTSESNKQQNVIRVTTTNMQSRKGKNSKSCTDNEGGGGGGGPRRISESSGQIEKKNKLHAALY